MEFTTDMWFTLFLTKEKNIPIARYEIVEDFKRRRKAKFFFEMSEVEWRGFKLGFKESIYNTIKYGLEELKDLVH